MRESYRKIGAGLAVLLVGLAAGWAHANEPLGRPMRASRIGGRLSQRLTQAREASEESEEMRLTPTVRQRSVHADVRTRQVDMDASRELKTRRAVAAGR